MDEIDYYLPEREYDTEEGATYETEAEKAGIKPGSLREQVRAAQGKSGDEEKSMRESITVGTAPQPSEDVATGQGPVVPPASEDTTYTTPTYWGKENIAEVNDIMGGTPAVAAAPETVWERGLRAVQTVAVRAADVFTRSRGGW